MPRITSRHSLFEQAPGQMIKDPLDARYRARFRAPKYDFVRFSGRDTVPRNGMTIATSAGGGSQNEISLSQWQGRENRSGIVVHD